MTLFWYSPFFSFFEEFGFTFYCRFFCFMISYVVSKWYCRFNFVVIFYCCFEIHAVILSVLILITSFYSLYLFNVVPNITKFINTLKNGIIMTIFILLWKAESERSFTFTRSIPLQDPFMLISKLMFPLIYMLYISSSTKNL